MTTLATILGFLLDHADLIDDVYQAITSGKVTKDDLRKAVRDALVAASDAEMKRELG